MRSIKLCIVLMVIFLVSCSIPGNNVHQQTPLPTSTLPEPQVFRTQVPETGKTMENFLNYWKNEDYSSMYQMISSGSKEEIGEEQFVQRYTEVANEAAMKDLLYQVSPGQITPTNAEIPFRITLVSAIIGEISRDMSANLILEQGQWKINWSDRLILPELANGNYLRMDPDIPARATIYDRYDNPLATQVEAVAIGLWPDYVDSENADGLISLLSTLTGYRSYTIAGMIENAEVGEYLALGEISIDKDPRRLELLSEYGAAVTASYSSRLYIDGGVGPHIVGYVSAIQEDELLSYRRQGYRADERIGREGIELWGEDILSGVRGGTLYVFNPDGKPIAQLGSSTGQPGKDIYTTLERDFQREVQKAMSIYNGAIVVLERDTGRVIAMVSSPGFNPNAYQTENYNWNTLISDIVNNPDSPHFNRGTQGQYPLGSVFKIITLAAALETGLYSADTIYECGYVFDELPGFERYDWTYEHFQEDGITRPSGTLTLRETLIRSCNPFYWHVGLDLYNRGLTTAISDMAAGFGLGEKTGIEVVPEEAGNIPVPESQVDALNLAIGQGDMLVTPLQVARFIAAIGNGGTLYRPQAIEKIVGQSGTIESEFTPDAQGKLPVSDANLELIREAMLGVVRNTIPEGTAYRAFNGLNVPIAGKTGTATASQGEPHAWFAGYTFAEQEDRPDIAIVVIAENAGEGSEIAAPIFRRVIELYFFGRPVKLYRWEANFDVTRSPTPIVTDTPTPQGGLNP